jgi:hypothetical protein
MEEFEKLVAESFQAELTPTENAVRTTELESAEPAELEVVRDDARAEEKAG